MNLFCCTSGFCPISQISWLWYIVAVVVSFGVGALWYGKLFSKAWIKAVEYKCACGADLQKGEKCTCKSRSVLPMVLQFVSTALIALMYFILVAYGAWLALAVAIAVSAWMKASLKFRIADWKRFVTLASIDVGYFFIVSLICIGLAMI